MVVETSRKKGPKPTVEFSRHRPAVPARVAIRIDGQVPRSIVGREVGVLPLRPHDGRDRFGQSSRAIEQPRTKHRRRRTRLSGARRTSVCGRNLQLGGARGASARWRSLQRGGARGASPRKRSLQRGGARGASPRKRSGARGASPRWRSPRLVSIVHVATVAQRTSLSHRLPPTSRPKQRPVSMAANEAPSATLGQSENAATACASWRKVRARCRTAHAWLIAVPRTC